MTEATNETKESILDLPVGKHPDAIEHPASGDIALKYYQPGQVLLQNNPSQREYAAVTQANICMAWIDPQDVDHILAKRGGCCGGKKQLFTYANESDVRRWTNRGGE